MNTHRYWLPASYNACESLPVRCWSFVPEAKLLVSLLTWKHAYHQGDRNGFSQLHSDWLRVLLGRNYSRVVESLTASHTIERKNFRAGHASYGYRLAPALTRSPVVSEPVEATRIANRLTKWRTGREAEQVARWQSIHFDLERRQRFIEIDREAALCGLPENCRLAQSCLIEAIATGCHRLSVGTASERVTTSVGLLKRSIRQATLTADGQPLVEIDVRCSQPSILANVMGSDPNRIRWLLRGLELPRFNEVAGRGFRAFQAAIEEGNLYEQLRNAASDIEGAEISRDEIKTLIMRDVFGRWKRYSTAVTKAFAKLWPSVADYVWSVNRGERSLIVKLQTIEARLITQLVASRLASHLPSSVGIAPVHDCLIVPNNSQAAATEAFDSVTAELGFKLKHEAKGMKPSKSKGDSC